MAVSGVNSKNESPQETKGNIAALAMTILNNFFMFLYDLKINIQTNFINTRHRIACDIYTLEQTTGAVIHLRIHTRIGTHGEEILTTGIDTQTFHIFISGNRNRITDG